MADHYRVLGVSNSATKDEIKHAFRKLAVQFHPDKHAQSPKPTRDAATLKFKQVSEAYEVLIDDRKRAAYNISRYSHKSSSSSYSYYGNNSGYGYWHDREYYRRGGSYYQPPPPPRQPPGNGFVNKVEAMLRFMMTRSFLLNLAFAGMLFGGAVAIDMSGEALWKSQNPGNRLTRVKLFYHHALLTQNMLKVYLAAEVFISSCSNEVVEEAWLKRIVQDKNSRSRRSLIAEDVLKIYFIF